jgi:hypothetical protein
VDDTRRRGCAAAGVRLAGVSVSSVCRLDLYGTWRPLTCFESPQRCILLLVAEHSRSENPYRLLYEVLGIAAPDEPRTKPACCDKVGQPPIDPHLITRFEEGARDLSRGLRRPSHTSAAQRRRRRA